MTPSQDLLEFNLDLQRRVTHLEQDNQQKKAELAQLRQEHERLQQSETRYRQLFENAPVSMLFINTEGYITQMNRAAEQQFGLSLLQLNQQGAPIFTNPQLVENGTLPYMLRALAGETVIEEPTYYDSSKDFDGGKFHYGKGHYCPIRDKAGVVREIVEINPDFADLWAAQQALLAAEQARAELLKTMTTIANHLLRSSDYRLVLPDVLQLLGEAARADRCSLAQNITDPVSGKSAARMNAEWCRAGIQASVAHTPELASALLWEDFAELYERLIQGETVQFFGTDLCASLRKLFESQGNKAMLMVPIVVQGEFWGVFGFDYCHKVRRFEELDQSIFAIAVDSIAAAIERQRSQQALLQAEQNRTAELAKVNVALRRSLDALSSDPDIERFVGHVLKVVAEQLDAPVTEYWSDSGNIACLELSCWQGEIVTKEQLSLDPRTKGIEIPPELVNHEALEQRQHHFIVEDLPTDPVELSVFSPLGFDLEAWCRERGVRKHLNVPLRLGNKSIGSLGVYIPANRCLSEQQIELAYAFAQQVTLAIRLHQLAESAKLAAIATEQEKAAQQRAAELAKANAVLRRTAAQLTEQQDLNQFLEGVLLAVAQETGARVNAVFLYNPQSETLLMQKAVCDGQVVNLKTDARFSMWRSPVPANVNASWQNLQSRGYSWHELEDNEIQGDEIWEFSIAWHRQMHHRTTMAILLQVGEQPLGFMGLCFCERLRPSLEQLELILALAQQAALAIQLTQLAEQSKQAALAKLNEVIAQEREKAAQERAAQLAKANDALKGAMAALATEPELDKFLSHILSEITGTAGAWASHLFLYDPQANTLQQHIAVQGGKTYLGTAPNDPPMFSKAFPADITEAWQYLLATRKLVLRSTDKPDAMVWPETIPWHKAQGHLCHAGLGLIAGEQPFGFLCLAFQDKTTLTQEEIELVEALANQATLAIQMTRLAESAKQEAQQTAIVEERNRIAQEIHDTLAQAFTGISIHLGIAHRLALSQSGAVTSLIEQATQLAHTGLAEARRSVWALQPDADEYRYLVPSLERVLQQMTSRTAIGAELRIVGTPYPLPPDVGLNLLRIGQEALTNALKYAFAQSLIVEIEFTLESVCLRVQDDGCGFDPTRHSDKGGFGLKGMQQRCERVGGELTITSVPGQGTAIVAWVPLVPGAANKGKSPEIPMSHQSAIRVLVVDDHPVVRRGLVTLLNLEPGVTIVAEASDGMEAVSQYRIHQPDVTLMDLRLPLMNGVEAIATIRQEEADSRILILTTYDGDEDIYRGLRAGALGYLLKDASCDEILDAIRTVHQGQKYLPTTVGVKLAEP